MQRPTYRIHFAKDVIKLSARDVRDGVDSWTCAKESAPGDVALLYFLGNSSALRFIARVTDKPEKEEGSPIWARAGRLYYFTGLDDITPLKNPIGLETIRRTFPRWKAWSNLHGRITVEVPQSLLGGLAALITKANPDVKRYFSRDLRVPTRVELEAPEKAIRKSYLEGQKKERVLELISRNPRLAIEAKEKWGLDCQICGFNFEKIYGPLGRDFIEVHHLRQLARQDGKGSKITVNDVRPVCSNCHSIIHRRKDMLSLRKVKRALRRR